MPEKLGELLVKNNLITSQQLGKALEDQKASGGRLGDSLIKHRQKAVICSWRSFEDVTVGRHNPKEVLFSRHRR